MSKEKLFNQSEILLSTTTTDSHIKYANKNFCDIAGYTLEEIYGHLFKLESLGWGRLKINVKMATITG